MKINEDEVKRNNTLFYLRVQSMCISVREVYFCRTYIMAAANSEQVLHHFATTMMRAFKDGRVDRSPCHHFVPASLDPATGVQSKDLQISPEINLSARVYRPGNATPGDKFPLLVYFHGGGFAFESAFSPIYHNHLNLMVAEAKVVAVSVNYRLAPEHPLPTAYEDSWLALKWVASRPDWIKDYADLTRVYFGGDSAGGNIAHYMGMRVGSEKPEGINLIGIFVNCGFFYGNEEAHKIFPKGFCDEMWRFACPNTTGYSEDPWINPAKDPNLSGLGCRRLLVYTAEKDILKGGNWHYKDALMRSGWGGDIEMVEVEREDHVFSVLSPDTENAVAMLKKVASFMNY